MNDKTRFSLRIAAGVYLLYLAYSLFKDWSASSGFRIVSALCIALFAVVGIILVVMSVRELTKKK